MTRHRRNGTRRPRIPGIDTPDDLLPAPPPGTTIEGATDEGRCSLRDRQRSHQTGRRDARSASQPCHTGVDFYARRGPICLYVAAPHS